MNPIKVYLQYLWKFPDSAYYKYLVQNPPKGVIYLNSENKEGVIINKNAFYILKKSKRLIRGILDKVNVSVPSAVYTKKGGNIDLIHCAHCLSKNKKEPWIADFEGEWQMYIGEKTKSSKKRVLNILKRGNCKKIIPWTEKVKEDIIKEYPKIKDKVKRVYPAVPLKIQKKKFNRNLRILYATRSFWIKGGLIALETLNKIKEKYPSVKIDFISNTPQYLKDKYKGINFFDPIPQEELFNHMKESDIFFYPSLMDTFGFAILEAMSFGLVPIALDVHSETPSIKEIIEDEKTGIVVDFKKRIPEYYSIGKEEETLVGELNKKLSELIENEKLREKISSNCINLIQRGKFSIENRKREIKNIYEEALK